MGYVDYNEYHAKVHTRMVVDLTEQLKDKSKQQRILPGDKEEDEIIKRQEAPSTRWNDALEAMQRKLEEIEVEAKELNLERLAAQIIK